MKVFLWHVHGGYTNALVQGGHEYLLPVLPDRGDDGRGRSQTFDWPASAVEVTPEEAADADVDVVILQRPEELHHLAAEWLGDRDVPTVYLEHSLPQGRISEMRHAAADRRDLTLVHVTHFNALFWDTGTTRTRVIEHGVVDPGYRYSGELARGAVVVNEPVRRGRVTGTDLLPSLNGSVPLDLFGMGTEEIGGIGDVAPPRLWNELGRRRSYVHPIRWTSLGLSLLEAMHVGMPIVALATTEVVEAVPPEAGEVSTSVERLSEALRRFIADPDEARERGLTARRAALDRYALDRFLADWDAVLEEAAA
ncbi:MAG TPA: glycosyltransferase [Gaiellaceae bacterium]|nr:glycosyltransferase [Gaiellaceae bacterium]